MSDVYDTYVDKRGFERWCSNGKKVLVMKKGKWVPSVKKVRNDDKQTRNIYR